MFFTLLCRQFPLGYISITMSQGSNATASVNEDFKEFYVQARFITGLILYPIFCVLGLIGNGLGIAVMLQKQMRSSTNVYLLALAISDGIKIICDALYFLVVLFLEIDPKIGNRLYMFVPIRTLCIQRVPVHISMANGGGCGGALCVCMSWKL